MGHPNPSRRPNTTPSCSGSQNEFVHRTLRIGLAQVNTTVGDLTGNTRLITEWIDRAREQDGAIFNAAAFIRDGAVKGIYHKVFLPNYGVFDEQRYFTIGHRCPIFEQSGIRIGVTICEDCWYPSGPMAWQAEHGVELLVNINGSPYHEGKRGPREEMVRGRAVDYGAYVAYVNAVGGQDELVFDGNSVIFDPRGDMVAHSKSFREDLLVYDIDVGGVPFHRPLEKIRHEAEGAARLE